MSGKGVCPADGAKLENYRGDLIPPNITVKKCNRCGKWWFPGDSMFNYKPATEAKINYFQKWGIGVDIRTLLLPTLALLVMISGTFVSVRMVLQKQQANIAASVGISEFNVTYTGNGQALAVFRVNKPVTQISYQKSGSLTWKEAAVVTTNGYYVAKISGLADGEQYIVSVLGKEYGFVAK
jgi:hypothetical protein